MDKTFRKELWLVDANQSKADGILTEAEVNYAYSTWVADFDGKTKTEIGGDAIYLKNRWFE